MWLAWLGCTPLWPPDGVAPRGEAPWAYPTDDWCLEQDDPGFEVDGFLFCASDAEKRIIAVDDPILRPCASVPAEQQGLVYSVFDGTRAMAFPLLLLAGREIVHVNWDGEPLLVDY